MFHKVVPLHIWGVVKNVGMGFVAFFGEFNGENVSKIG